MKKKQQTIIVEKLELEIVWYLSLLNYLKNKIL